MLKIYRDNNPILAPMDDLPWTKQSVFNPGVVYDKDRFRMIFSGNDGKGCIQLGYAESSDGVNFTVRETPFLPPDPNEKAFDHGTTEDPRVTLLDGKFYITYAARCVNMNDWVNGKRTYDLEYKNIELVEEEGRRAIRITIDNKNSLLLLPQGKCVVQCKAVGAGAQFLNGSNDKVFKEVTTWLYTNSFYPL